MSHLPESVNRRLARPVVDDETVWYPTADVDETRRHRDEALRAEGRQQAWATMLILVGAGGLMTGFRSPGTALLALVVLIYGLVTAARITRIH